jgi:hypothetical protein
MRLLSPLHESVEICQETNGNLVQKFQPEDCNWATGITCLGVQVDVQAAEENSDSKVTSFQVDVTATGH